jgi:hypothetical protein
MGAARSILFMILGIVLLALSASGSIEMGPMGYVGSIACVGFGAVALYKLRMASRALKSELLQDPRVVGFYQNTQAAWASGELAELNKSFQGEGQVSYDRFVKKYRPIDGGALQVMFTQFPPMPREYLVGVGDLTNQRLILKDATAGLFREFHLADIDSFEAKGTWTKTIAFRMKSGGVTTVEKLEIFPRAEFLSRLISRSGSPGAAVL